MICKGYSAATKHAIIVSVGLVCGLYYPLFGDRGLLVLVYAASFMMSFLFPARGLKLLAILTPWAGLFLGFTVESAKGFIGLPVSPLEVIVLALWARHICDALRRGLCYDPWVRAHSGIVFWLFLSAFTGLYYGSDITVLVRNVLMYSVLLPASALVRSGTIRIGRNELGGIVVVSLVLALVTVVIYGGVVGSQVGGISLLNGLVINRVDTVLNTFLFALLLCWGLSTSMPKRTFVIVLSILGIVLSLGRSLWLAGAVLVIAFAFQAKRLKTVLVVIVLVIAIVAFMSSSLYTQRMFQGRASSDYRLLEVQVIIGEMMSVPLNLIVGKGLGAQVPYELAIKFPAHNYVWWIHNEWLLMLYNTGMIGVILYAGMYLYSLKYLKPFTLLWYATIAYVVVSFTAGQVISMVTGPWLSLFFCLQEVEIY